jgi:hypothetical protein
MSIIVSIGDFNISFVAFRFLLLQRVTGGVSSLPIYDESLPFDFTLAVFSLPQQVYLPLLFKHVSGG